EPGNYRVAVRLAYKNNHTLFSDWSNQISITVAPHTLTLADIPDSGIKTCLLNSGSGFTANSLVSSIDRIECSNQNLDNTDLSQISQYFSGVRYINISNNQNITGISGLGKLPHLKILDISENPNFNTANLRSEERRVGKEYRIDR